MAFPDLFSLFTSADYQLPYLEADDSKSFLYYFESRMKKFIFDLQGCKDPGFSNTDHRGLVKTVTANYQALIKVLELYLNGYPASAYREFSAFIKADAVFDDLCYVRNSMIEADTALFRVRKEYDKVKSLAPPNGFISRLQPKQLFHVPFENRRSIGTNRYSIPGFPCLYISDHLQTSWSETIEKADQAFHAICYRNHRRMYFLDLVPLSAMIKAAGGAIPPDLLTKFTPIDLLTNYALIYPFICACHSKILYIPKYDGEVQFKSEYIIPQLLMQFFREEKLAIDGVRYLSCTAEAKFPGTTFNKHNYVLPVKDVQEIGLCQSLVINFSATPVYSYMDPAPTGIEKELGNIQSSLEGSVASPLYI